jgi:hypothetical protein
MCRRAVNEFSGDLTLASLTRSRTLDARPRQDVVLRRGCLRLDQRHRGEIIT